MDKNRTLHTTQKRVAVALLQFAVLARKRLADEAAVWQALGKLYCDSMRGLEVKSPAQGSLAAENLRDQLSLYRDLLAEVQGGEDAFCTQLHTQLAEVPEENRAAFAGQLAAAVRGVEASKLCSVESGSPETVCAALNARLGQLYVPAELDLTDDGVYRLLQKDSQRTAALLTVWLYAAAMTVAIPQVMMNSLLHNCCFELEACRAWYAYSRNDIGEGALGRLLRAAAQALTLASVHTCVRLCRSGLYSFAAPDTLAQTFLQARVLAREQTGVFLANLATDGDTLPGDPLPEPIRMAEQEDVTSLPVPDELPAPDGLPEELKNREEDTLPT